MAVVAGVVFFFLRALLALIPGVADRVPIKKVGGRLRRSSSPLSTSFFPGPRSRRSEALS